ncbi:MAG: hypothetical protein ACI4N3_01170 [Alphaproteobacteria bacterium]
MKINLNNKILLLTSLGLLPMPTISNAQTFYQCIKKPEEQKPEPTTYCYPGYYLSSNETCVKCPDYQYSPGGRTKACKYPKIKACTDYRCRDYEWKELSPANKDNYIFDIYSHRYTGIIGFVKTEFSSLLNQISNHSSTCYGGVEECRLDSLTNTAYCIVTECWGENNNDYHYTEKVSIEIQY